MHQRAAAASTLGHHHLAAMARQKPHRRLVDLRRQHLLRAAREQRHAFPARTFGLEHLRRVSGRSGGQPRGREVQHRAQGFRKQRGDGLRQHRADQRQAESRRAGQHEGKELPLQAVEQGPRVGLLDMRAGMVDQMHVIDARGAGGHASETGQAAIDMAHRALVGGAGVFQHVLDEIYPPARAIQFVAQQHESRTGRGAEAAMHAGAQNPVRLGDVGVGKLRLTEEGLHVTRRRTCGRG